MNDLNTGKKIVKKNNIEGGNYRNKIDYKYINIYLIYQIIKIIIVNYFRKIVMIRKYYKK